MKQSKIVFTTLFTCMVLVSSVAQGQTSALSVDASLAAPQGFQAPSPIELQTPVKPVFLPQACEKSGDAEYGSIICKQTLENGSLMKTESHVETAFNEVKIQIRFTTTDAKGQLTDKKVIRRKTTFKDMGGDKLTKEQFDIVSYPVNEKITREILIFEYAENGKMIKKISWAKYNQMGETDFAALLYNVALTYDTDGMPLKGRAERWKDGEKASEFFRWDRVLDGVKGFDAEAWKQWEGLTQAAALREIFPL